jgi:hypothetical protein
MPLRGVSELVTGADGFGLRATDGGLRPPPPSSVEPSGIPAGPTVDPGPMDEAKGADAVADAAQVVGAVALMPPPSKTCCWTAPSSSLPCRQTLRLSSFPSQQMLPSLDCPWQQTPAPTKRRRMARRSRAPRRMWSDSRPALRARSRRGEFQFARPAHWECQAETSCRAPGGARRSCALVHRQSRSPRELPPSPSQSALSWTRPSHLGIRGEPPRADG